jgi:hypothetical protein
MLKIDFTKNLVNLDFLFCLGFHSFIEIRKLDILSNHEQKYAMLFIETMLCSVCDYCKSLGFLQIRASQNAIKLFFL